MMNLPKRYNPATTEPALQEAWQAQGVYHFQPESDAPRYTIDTPPPTVSGYLHLGHVYSYSHTDFMARFWRMNGYNVFYPMGYDDNGLPTERLVEKRLGITAQQVGLRAFIEKCLAVSEEAEKEYQELWQRLGLSIDWRYSYRTMDEQSRRISQWSFIDLYRQGLAYRRQAPTIWCPECRTAIAQAEVDDLERPSELVTLAFQLADGRSLPIATTRPELLPACVAIFVHPDDQRFAELVGQQAVVPLYGQSVPILADPAADPAKGSGAVMCCTFGDTADVAWWNNHQLPLIEAIGRDGRLTAVAGPFTGLIIATARMAVIQAADEAGLVLQRQPVSQTVRVHERCDTAVEFIVTRQWFIRVLENRAAFLAAGEQISWRPEQMKARYRQWVANLGWDWCISRQRYFGVPFPAWYCDACGEILLADVAALPVDPSEQAPDRPCACGGTRFSPDQDVMDTWATSALTPQIVGRWSPNPAPASPGLYEQLFPMSLRPQAHEIIRTWAFYTIVKSHYHFNRLPWQTVAISGWGLAPAGSGKISKSRGGGPVAPLAMIEQYSADAVRYWAASTGFGRDSVISEAKVQAGAKLVNKLWNMAQFSRRFLEGYEPPAARPLLSPADRWILSLLQQLIERVTSLFHQYEYATAKSESEVFFWNLADNYLEMAKKRLYDPADPAHEGARYTLHQALLTLVKLLAPFLPHVTEAIYQGLFETAESLHRARWPAVDEQLVDEKAVALGELMLVVATAVRRYKSEHNLSLGSELAQLQLHPADPGLSDGLATAVTDLQSITRARAIHLTPALDPDAIKLTAVGVTIALRP
jgi:valyl-tRNA synthetase